MEYRGTLLLGAVPRITVPIAHSLFRKGIPTFSAFFTTEQHPIRSRAIKRSVDLAPLQSSNSQLLDALINIIEDEDIDYLVPCNDSSLHYILRHYDVLSENCTVGCPAPEILLKVLDKSITLSFAKECAIPVPKEIPGSTSIEQIEAELAFPVAVKVKSKVDEGDFKVRYFNTIDELRDTAKSIPHFLDRYFVQEYCPGEGVGVEVLMNEGRPVMIFQHRRVAEHPRSGGVSALAISESPEPRLVDMAVRLLQALRWQGVAMVEFKHDRNTGKTVLMEVNGRYWGSLGLSTACRFDFPYIQWALDHGVAVEIPRDYPVGVKARWTAGVLGNLLNAFDRREEGLSFRSEVGMAISEISPAAKDMLFDWKDPLPAVEETVQLLNRELLAITKRRLRSAFPGAIGRIRFIRQYGPAFATRIKLRNLRRRVRRPQFPANVKNILFVCHGNIIRSPLAEHLLRKRLPPQPQLIVRSAGMFAVDRRPADPRVITAATRLFDLDLSAHRATRLNSEQVLESDVIFVMDRQNEIALLQNFPNAAPKLFLLGELCTNESANADEIPDPYQGSDEDIVECCTRIANCLDEALLVLNLRSAIGNSRNTIKG